MKVLCLNCKTKKVGRKNLPTTTTVKSLFFLKLLLHFKIIISRMFSAAINNESQTNRQRYYGKQ